MSGADAIARAELEALNRAGLLRSLEPLRTPPGAEVELIGPRGPERLINFSSNDYLGFAADRRIAQALADGALTYGAGAGASRLVVGDSIEHRALEAALSRFERTEAAVLFNSGYAANCGLLPTLVGPGDALLSDALNHASLIDGCRLSRAKVVVYPHLDLGALEAGLRETSSARRRLVVTDAVFSMDGDRAPLEEIAALCERYGAMLVVDEAHATGVLGPRGAGLAEELGQSARIDARMGTLSKAAGVVGAYVVATRAVCDLLINRARPLIFSTALPPAVATAGLRAIELLSGPEGDVRRTRLWERIRRLSAGLRALGLAAEARSAIFPVIVGSAPRAVALAQALRERGLLVKPIRPPTVPEGTSRLRIAVSAAHTDEQVDRLVDALRELL